MSSLYLLQGIFPTQGSNPGLPYCSGILYHLSHKRSLRILDWVAYPFSSGSFQPRNIPRPGAKVDFANLIRICILIKQHILVPFRDVHLCSATQSSLTLCDPMDCSPLGSSILGNIQGRILEWVVITFSNFYIQ